MPFTFRHLEIPEIVVVESQRYADTRGSFFESYKQSAFATNGLQAAFVQDNCSHSVRNVLRGLHYQKRPAAQGKLVLVAAGEIFDVAVDIRKGSPTFGRWTGARLVTSHMIYIPSGFAHGFCVVSDEATAFAIFPAVKRRNVVHSYGTAEFLRIRSFTRQSRYFRIGYC